jgi:hypothetical protein
LLTLGAGVAGGSGLVDGGALCDQVGVNPDSGSVAGGGGGTLAFVAAGPNTGTPGTVAFEKVGVLLEPNSGDVLDGIGVNNGGTGVFTAGIVKGSGAFDGDCGMAGSGKFASVDSARSWR